MDIANTVNVYITNHRNNSVALPVAPTDIQINFESSDITSNVIGHGEINRVGDNKLKTVSINTILPLNSHKVAYTTANGEDTWIKATSYLTFLKNIQKDKKPCQLVITGTGISLSATLNVDYGMSNGNAQEYSVKLSFTEHRPVYAEHIGAGKRKIIKHGKKRAKPGHKVSLNSEVLVNGMAYLTKNATNGVMIRKQKCNITLISSGAKHPYYVKNIYGTALGWVGKGAIK